MTLGYAWKLDCVTVTMATDKQDTSSALASQPAPLKQPQVGVLYTCGDFNDGKHGGWWRSQILIQLWAGTGPQFNEDLKGVLHCHNEFGGGPRVVVSTAAFHARVRGSVPGLGGLKETKNVSSPSTCETQYCGEPPWPRGSVLGLRPPGLEFRILSLEDSVISIISPSSGGSPGPV